MEWHRRQTSPDENTFLKKLYLIYSSDLILIYSCELIFNLFISVCEQEEFVR